jgi:hypothetical protein
LHNSERNLLANTVAKSNDKLETDILSGIGVYLKCIEQPSADGGEACS